MSHVDLGTVTFDDLLAELRALRVRAGNDAALGRLLHLRSKGQHVVRYFGENPPRPEVVTCLWIAEAIPRRADDVLTAAGHEDVARIIRKHYGSPRVRPKTDRAANLPDDLVPLVNNWQHLDDVHRRLARDLAEYAASAATSPAHRRKPTRPARTAEGDKKRVRRVLRDLAPLEQSAGDQSTDHPGTGTGGEKEGSR